MAYASMEDVSSVIKTKRLSERWDAEGVAETIRQAFPKGIDKFTQRYPQAWRLEEALMILQTAMGSQDINTMIKWAYSQKTEN